MALIVNSTFESALRALLSNIIMKVALMWTKLLTYYYYLLLLIILILLQFFYIILIFIEFNGSVKVNKRVKISSTERFYCDWRSKLIMHSTWSRLEIYRPKACGLQAVGIPNIKMQWSQHKMTSCRRWLLQGSLRDVVEPSRFVLSDKLSRAYNFINKKAKVFG